MHFSHGGSFSRARPRGCLLFNPVKLRQRFLRVTSRTQHGRGLGAAISPRLIGQGAALKVRLSTHHASEAISQKVRASIPVNGVVAGRNSCSGSVRGLKSDRENTELPEQI
jgi:hypothetical protein